MAKFTDAVRATLTGYFNAGDQPTEAQFTALILAIQEGIEEHDHSGTGDGDGVNNLIGPVGVGCAPIVLFQVGDTVTAATGAASPGGASDHCAAVTSDTATETVSWNLAVDEGARKGVAKFFLTDGAAEAGAWGLWQSWTAGGAQPFVLGIGANELMRITTAGLVGLLTDDPKATLDVRAQYSYFGDEAGEIFFRDNTINYGASTDANFDGWINYEGFDQGTTQFRDLKIADGKHNVLVWFDGSSGTLGGGGNQDVGVDNTGKIYAPFVSDQKFKRNIKSITGGLDVVKSLRGVTYNWNKSALARVDLNFGECGQQVGFIAQEVVGAIPQAQKSGKRYESFDRRMIMPYLVEAIKELDARLTQGGL